jgi:hypothetical protein
MKGCKIETGSPVFAPWQVQTDEIAKNTKHKMNRITKKQIQASIDTINSILNRPDSPYSQVDGKCVANIGNFSLSQAYGGYCVHLMVNENGGVSCPIWCGHITASDAYWRLCAFISGLDFKK